MKVVFAFVLMSLMGSLVYCKQNVFAVEIGGTIEAYAASRLRDDARTMQTLRPGEQGDTYQTIFRFGSYAYTWEKKANSGGTLRRWNINSEGKLKETDVERSTSSGPIHVQAPSDTLVTDRIIVIDGFGKFVQVLDHENFDIIAQIQGPTEYPFELTPAAAVLTSNYLYVAYWIGEGRSVMIEYDPTKNYDKFYEKLLDFEVTSLATATNADIYALGWPGNSLYRLDINTLEWKAQTTAACAEGLNILLLSEDQDICYVACNAIFAFAITEEKLEPLCQSEQAGASNIVYWNNRLYASGFGISQFKIKNSGGQNGCPVLNIQAPGQYQGMLAVIPY
ncbi:hypothetical protein NDN08_005917 [Rhodosorus marinus]|uniref:Uncharacterized protein n=1 Tax=Rhodosorus marinus TaxID=101924 RepID=A0AAV8V313_9RHOD|nr:hypothetical protein NDN08_005917 [Rhodosorus marinus]